VGHLRDALARTRPNSRRGRTTEGRGLRPFPSQHHTLQHYPLPSVTATVTRKKVRSELPGIYQRVEKVSIELIATTNRASNAPQTACLVSDLDLGLEQAQREFFNSLAPSETVRKGVRERSEHAFGRYTEDELGLEWSFQPSVELRRRPVKDFSDSLSSSTLAIQAA
jgi:hypothetical protein